MGEVKKSDRGREESRREWIIDIPHQLEQVSAAYNLLLEVSFEAAELLRVRQGSPAEKDFQEFKNSVEKAMSLLLEARRKLISYCG